jgi:hypothetical protein
MIAVWRALILRQSLSYADAWLSDGHYLSIQSLHYWRRKCLE